MFGSEKEKKASPTFRDQESVQNISAISEKRSLLADSHNAHNRPLGAAVAVAQQQRKGQKMSGDTGEKVTFWTRIIYDRKL